MSSLRACVGLFCSSNEAVSGMLVALLEEGCALTLLLAVGVRFALGKAAGYEGASLGLTLSGRCGPVSTGPEAHKYL